MRRVFILVVLLILSCVAFTQNPEKKECRFGSAFYGVSYFGYNLIKPGLEANINWIINEVTAVRSKTVESGKTIKKLSTKQIIVNANIGFIWYPQSHFAIFNYYQATFKKIKRNSHRFTTVSIGPGVYRSFYPETYKLNENGEVQKIFMAGRIYFSAVLSFGNGKIIKNKIFKTRFINTNLMFLFDYNTGVVPLLSIEIGFKIK